MTSEKLCLKWNDFQEVFTASVGSLRDDTDFTDVTLACEDQSVKAHKVILSACSPFFKRLLKSHPHPQPLLYMRGIKASELVALVDFVYHGEANIFQEQLESFLTLAEELELKGLSENSEEITSELPNYRPTKKEHFPSQDQPRTHLSRENNTHGGLTPKSEYPAEMVPNARQSVTRIDPDTLAKIDSMVEKRADGYSCNQCEHTAKTRQHMREHVEKHIEGLQYSCNFCDRVLRSSHALRSHKSRNH